MRYLLRTHALAFLLIIIKTMSGSLVIGGSGNPYASLFRIRLLSILISLSDFIFFQNNYEKLCRIEQSNKQPKMLSYLSQILRSTKFTLQSYFIAVATWGVSPI